MSECYNCKYSDFPEKGSIDDELGSCRKYAPRPLMANQKPFNEKGIESYEGALSPQVDLADWCWEWEKAPTGKGKNWEGW